MRTILLWDVDTQTDFMDKTGKLFVPGSEEKKIRENIRSLTQVGEMRSIIYPEVRYIAAGSVDAHTPDDPEFKDWPEHCVYGTPGQRKIPESLASETMYIPSVKLKDSQIDEIVKYRGQKIFEKQTTDCRTNPNVRSYVDKIKPDIVAVYGVVSEICVDKAVDYFTGTLGYKTNVIKDAIKEFDAKKCELSFSKWKDLGVDFITTEEILQGRLDK